MSQLTGLSVVRIFIVPSSFAFQVPDDGSGSGRPLIRAGVSTAYRYWLVRSVLNLIHSSRRSLSLFSRSRSARIFEPSLNVPSGSSTNSPSITVVVTTASPGSATPATCSFTRITAFEPSATVKPTAPGGTERWAGVGGGAGVEAGGTAVADGEGVTAAPPHAARKSETAATAARSGIARRTCGRAGPFGPLRVILRAKVAPTVTANAHARTASLRGAPDLRAVEGGV